MPTQHEHEIVQAMERDRAVQERRGVNAAAQLGFQLQAAVIRAYRLGHDPAAPLEALFKRSGQLIRDSMVASHLAGLKRTTIFYAKQPKPALQLTTTTYGESIKALKRRLGLTAAQVTALTEVYGPQALKVLTGVKATVERALQKELIKIQMKGLHVRDGVKQLGKAFKRLGITPSSSFALENVFRTQTQLAYSAGRWQADQDPAVQAVLWGYKYVTVGDARVRPTHVALDGVTLPKDHERWNEIFPPNGFSCRCAAIPVFEERKVVEPKASAKVAGQQVVPGADAGFGFNPGKVF